MRQNALNTEEVRQIWNEWVASHPDPFESSARPADPALMEGIIPDVIQKLSLGPGDRLLDAGCGSGAMLYEISRRVHLAEAVGSDIAEKHIENAKRIFPEISFCAAPLEEMPFAEGAFNKVLCYSTLSYPRDWKKAVDEVLRVCRAGGMILFADLPLWHLRFYFYISVLASVPAALLQWNRLFRAVQWKAKDCPWNWTHLKELTSYLESKGCSVEVFEQPRHRQYGCVSHSYRRDIRVRKG